MWKKKEYLKEKKKPENSFLILYGLLLQIFK